VAFAALVIRVAGFSVQSAAGAQGAWNLAQYAIPLAAGALALAILFAGRRAPRLAALAPTGAAA
jgi:hypothetical protein